MDPIRDDDLGDLEFYAQKTPEQQEVDRVWPNLPAWIGMTAKQWLWLPDEQKRRILSNGSSAPPPPDWND